MNSLLVKESRLFRLERLSNDGQQNDYIKTRLKQRCDMKLISRCLESSIYIVLTILIRGTVSSQFLRWVLPTLESSLKPNYY